MPRSVHTPKPRVGKRALIALWRSRLPLAAKHELVTLASAMGDQEQFVIYSESDISTEGRAREEAIVSLLNELNIRHAEAVDWRSGELLGAFDSYFVESRMNGERVIWRWIDVPKLVAHGIDYTRRYYDRAPAEGAAT